MPVENPKIFFSYARADAEFVLKLAKDLRSAGTSLWLDQLDIPPGDRWDQAVEAALKASPCLLIILSPTSVASNNVMDEVSFALEENKKILPILYKNCGIPFRLRRLQHIDFTINYDTGFAELLKALGVQPGQTPLLREQPTSKTASGVKPEEKRTLAKSPLSPPSPSGSDMKVVPKKWKLGVLVGFLSGIALGFFAISITTEHFSEREWLAICSITGVSGAIVGAITGSDKRRIAITIVGFLLSFFLFMINISPRDIERNLASITFGFLTGAPLGAIAGVIIEKLMRKRGQAG